MRATKTQASPRFTSVDTNITVNIEDGWVLTGPPYFHYITPKPQIPLRQGSVKGEPRGACLNV